VAKSCEHLSIGEITEKLGKALKREAIDLNALPEALKMAI
jgi:hypothetical protein